MNKKRNFSFIVLDGNKEITEITAQGSRILCISFNPEISGKELKLLRSVISQGDFSEDTNFHDFIFTHSHAESSNVMGSEIIEESEPEN